MTNTDLTYYATLFKAWHKSLGAKPTADQLHTVHMLGLRPGKQALANAMALRPQGVTGSEIVVACGAPQLNRMRGLIDDGLVKRKPHDARNGHMVYALELTPKGVKRVTTSEARAAALAAKGEAGEPAPKAKRKARKAPAKAPGEPATVNVAGEATAAPVTQPAPTGQGEGDASVHV